MNYSNYHKRWLGAIREAISKDELLKHYRDEMFKATLRGKVVIIVTEEGVISKYDNETEEFIENIKKLYEERYKGEVKLSVYEIATMQNNIDTLPHLYEANIV